MPFNTKTGLWLYPLTIIFDDFGIWLLGVRNKLMCLYIPQGHYFKSTWWLWSIDEYVNKYFERKSIFNKSKHVRSGKIYRSRNDLSSTKSQLLIRSSSLVGVWRYLTKGSWGFLIYANLSKGSQLYLVQYWYHARIRSLNPTVLSNAGKVS